jgi:uncharacterized repeat protein (TIGR01451 family)
MAVMVMFAALLVLSVTSFGLRPAVAQDAQPTATPAPLFMAEGGDLDGDSVADPGDTLRYGVTVTNGGAQDSGPVEVVVRLDSTLIGTVTNISDGGAQGEDGEVVWPFDDIASEQEEALTFDATLRSRFPSGRSQLESVALVRSPDGTELARGATLPFEVVGPVLKLDDVSAEIVNDANDSGRLDAGDTVRLTVTYSNTGGSPSSDATVVSNYPEQLVAQIVDNPNDGVDDGVSINWGVGTVAADGETRQVQYDVQLVSEFPAGVTMVPISAEIRSGGVVRDTDELEISVGGANLTVETEIAFRLDQDGDLRGDTGDEVQFQISFANVGDEPATDVTVTADYNERFLEVFEPSDGGRVDSETGLVTWPLSEVGAGQRTNLTFNARLNALPEGLPVVNTGVRVESPDAPLDESNPVLQLDTAVDVTPEPDQQEERVLEEGPAAGVGPLDEFAVSVLLGAFLFLSLLAIAFVASRVLTGPPPGTPDERGARRSLVRELVEGFILAMILFAVMVLGLQNALDKDSVNSIIAGIVGYVAGRVASQR